MNLVDVIQEHLERPHRDSGSNHLLLAARITRCHSVTAAERMTCFATGILSTFSQRRSSPLFYDALVLLPEAYKKAYHLVDVALFSKMASNADEDLRTPQSEENMQRLLTVRDLWRTHTTEDIRTGMEKRNGSVAM